MFIEQNAISSPTPFGGAGLNETFTIQFHSAPPNGAGVFGPAAYKHLTPNGVKPSLRRKIGSPFVFPDRLRHKLCGRDVRAPSKAISAPSATFYRPISDKP